MDDLLIMILLEGHHFVYVLEMGRFNSAVLRICSCKLWPARLNLSKMEIGPLSPLLKSSLLLEKWVSSIPDAWICLVSEFTCMADEAVTHFHSRAMSTIKLSITR